MTNTTFIADQDIARAFDTVDDRDEAAPGLGAPPAPYLEMLGRGVGSSGGQGIDQLAATLHAIGWNLRYGTLDLAEISHATPVLSPHPGRSYAPSVDLYLHGEQMIEDAREVVDPSVLRPLLRGHSLADLSLACAGRGAAGIRQAALLAYIAREGEIDRWLARPLVPFAPIDATASGIGRWNAKRDDYRIVDITFAATCGAVGSGLCLSAVAVTRKRARQLGIELDQYLVLIGGRVFGRGTDAQVHERIHVNEDAFLVELEEAVVNGRVAVGTELWNLDEPLLQPGNVLLFDDDLRDSETGIITDQARRDYLAEVGLTVGIAIASGALKKASQLEVNDIKGAQVIRRVRLVGHGLDRGALARLLAGRRVERLREQLLNSLTEPSGELPLSQ